MMSYCCIHSVQYMEVQIKTMLNLAVDIRKTAAPSAGVRGAKVSTVSLSRWKDIGLNANQQRHSSGKN